MKKGIKKGNYSSSFLISIAFYFIYLSLYISISSSSSSSSQSCDSLKEVHGRPKMINRARKIRVGCTQAKPRMLKCLNSSHPPIGVKNKQSRDEIAAQRRNTRWDKLPFIVSTPENCNPEACATFLVEREVPRHKSIHCDTETPHVARRAILLTLVDLRCSIVTCTTIGLHQPNGWEYVGKTEVGDSNM